MKKTEVYGILTRQNITIWITKSEAVKISELIVKGKRFVIVRERVINTADITGIFKGEDIYDKNMQSRGLWKGDNGQWFAKNEDNWRLGYIPELSDLEKDNKLTLENKADVTV